MRKLLLAIAMIIVLSMSVLAQDDAQEWLREEIGNGIKPAIAIDTTDTIHIAYIVEAIMGTVEYAHNTNQVWETEEVSSGYFYGPLDIAVSLDGIPYIAYHDHQGETFHLLMGMP